MIKIIGTSHISPESVRKIKRTIKKVKPDLVAVELDPIRFEALRRGETVNISAIRYIGFRNYVVAKFFSWIQRYLGKKTGVMPGTEMLVAVRAAQEVKAKIAFIDQDIRKTLNSLKRMKFREKLGIFFSLFRKVKVKHEFDLRKVPEEELVDELIKYLKETSPTLYEVMIEERDMHMAHCLFNLSKKYEKIVAVVGMGHKKGIEEDLKEIRKTHDKIAKYRVKRSQGSYRFFGYSS